jgi:hypothetical protein
MAASPKRRLVTYGQSGSESQRALMHAVLQDAILCLRGHAYPTRDRARLAAEAEHWVKSTNRRWPFSFESVCAVLGLDPDALRQRLLRAVATESRCVDGGEGGIRGAAPVDEMVRALRRVRNPGNRTTRTLR